MDLAGYIEERVNDQIKQGSSTIQAYNCEAGTIVVVLDDTSAGRVSGYLVSSLTR